MNPPVHLFFVDPNTSTSGSKTVRFSDTGRIEVLLDVLNALNRRAEEGLVDDNLFSQNFARPNVFIDPRRAMIGSDCTCPDSGDRTRVPPRIVQFGPKYYF